MKTMHNYYLQDLNWAKSQATETSKKSVFGHLHRDNKGLTDNQLSRILDAIKSVKTTTNTYHINQAGIVGNPQGPITINNSATATNPLEQQQPSRACVEDS
ncbi:hypothetical protein VTP01DRAFT_10979 [Rhizomucor pusillus]|uniref:uncharacterized protein n=1 Tax=Rhizomucor pusillus TaxID=4840 RepID=UPI003742485E